MLCYLVDMLPYVAAEEDLLGTIRIRLPLLKRHSFIHRWLLQLQCTYIGMQGRQEGHMLLIVGGSRSSFCVRAWDD